MSSPTQDVLNCLNSAFEADPQAIRALLINRVPCNRELAEHPQVVVELDPADPENPETCMVGALGLINGVLSSLGFPIVAAKWSDPVNEHGNRKMLGFVAYDSGTGDLVQPCSPEPPRD